MKLPDDVDRAGAAFAKAHRLTGDAYFELRQLVELAVKEGLLLAARERLEFLLAQRQLIAETGDKER